MGSRVVVAARAGDEGKLYGSIGAGDVVEAVKKFTGVGLDREVIVLPEPVREIGLHEASFDQLFVVVTGEGWASDGANTRFTLAPQTGVFIRKGESHAKGSESGLTALIVQGEKLVLDALTEDHRAERRRV